MPPALRPILLAVRDTDACGPSLRYACTEARRAGVPVHLVHVLEDRARPQVHRLLEAVAADAYDLTEGAVPVHTELRTGPVVSELTELSREALLVVLQRRQLSRLQRLVTRSVSAHVGGRAHAPTVSVPEAWQPRLGDPRQVTVGGDGADSEEGRRLLDHALCRAAEASAELTVVHAWQLPSGYDDAVVALPEVEEWRERYLRVLLAQLEPLQALHPGVPVSVEIRHLHPAEALIQAAKDSDLVVLGRGRLEHPLVEHLGSVARAVIRDADCPTEVLCDRQAPDGPPVGDR
jgi:nucleotide-binding universal stress UspA family protein